MRLTKEMIENAPPSSVIFVGETIDAPSGLNMTHSDKSLKFVVYRGGIPDWCIYTHFADKSIEYITKQGDKPHTRENIANVVEFDDEVWTMYRH